MQPPFAPPPGPGFQPAGFGYGSPPPPPNPPVPSEAIIALACAFFTMSTSCFPLGFVALYYGGKARKIARERADSGPTATLALISMIVGGAFGVLWLLFWGLQLGMMLLGAGMVFFLA